MPNKPILTLKLPVLTALRSRNYRLFFIGQSLSMIGTFMTQVAIAWLIYELTGSAFLLGLAGFLGQLPTFVLAPFSGVLADRWNRYHLLIWVQIIGTILSLALTLLYGFDQLNVVLLIILSTLSGLLRGLDVPVRQAFVVEMLESRDDLTNAIALNASLINGARLIGPAIAGILIATIGAGSCFLIDTVSYVAVTAMLLSMQIQPNASAGISHPIWKTLKEGFSYVCRFLPIRSTLLLLALMSFMGMPYLTLLPVFAVEVFQGDATTLGFLTAASGLGAFLAGVYLSTRTTVLGLGKLIAWSPMILGSSLILFAFCPVFWLSLGLMAIAGFSSILQAASSNTLIQTIVDDNKRGRVMSFYAMCFMGTIPFGSLYAGGLANSIGAANTVAIGGVACIVGSIVFVRHLPQVRQVLRPIYSDRGILKVAPPLESQSSEG
ncbi:MAG: MFS transporter [Oculatellaceae cyanobacterium bins.114]|nr:MFS transporter [Oculatellaceae cyanobacterium bins.114]